MLSYFERLESRSMLAGDLAQNPVNRFDVNNDGRVTTADAMVIINDLKANGPHAAGTASTSGFQVQALSATTQSASNSSPTIYPDVTGDGFVSTADVSSLLTQLANPQANTNLVSVTLVATDTSGNILSGPIPVGTDFLLEAFVQDLIDNGNGAGVLSAYQNITYTTPLVTLAPGVSATLPANYQFFATNTPNTSTAGQINGIGATATNLLSDLGPNSLLLWSLPVHASAAGVVTFHAIQDPTVGNETQVFDFPSGTGGTDFYPDTSVIDPSQILFVDATVTITAATLPSLAIDNPSVTKPTSGTGNEVFTVTLSASSSQTVTVAYATADGTAKAPTDYTAKSGTLTFAPGTTVQKVTVSVVGNTAYNPNEKFTLTLSSPTNAQLPAATLSGTGTIINNNPAPSVTIVGPTVNKTAGSTGSAVFSVTVSGATELPVTLNYATANGTATAGSDFQTTTGSLTFTAAQLLSQPVTQFVTVPLLSNASPTGQETFKLNLTAITNALQTTATGTGTINYTALPNLAIDSPSVVKPTSNTANEVFTVTLSASSSQTVTVAYATADGTAKAPTDYTTKSGTLTFAPGTTVQKVTVSVVGNTAYNPNESFSLTLSSPTNASLPAATLSGTGTIINNNPAPSVTVSGPTVNKSAGSTGSAVFSVTVSGATELPVTLNYATANGTATAGSDFQTTTGSLTFTAAQLLSQPVTQFVTVPLLSNASPTGQETFKLNLTSITNALQTTATGTGTINYTALPNLTIDSPSVVKPTSGTGNEVFTVTLSASSSQTVTVAYATADGTAKAPTDYTTKSGTLTFAPGTTVQKVTVSVVGNTAYNPNEKFSLTLSSPTNAQLPAATLSGTGTIINNNPAPSVTVSGPTVNKLAASTASAVFSITVSGATELPVTLNYATANGTATAGSDFQTTTGSLTFTAAQLVSQPVTQFVTVPLLSNASPTGQETFQLNLTAITNALQTTASGTGTINYTALPTLAVDSPSVVKPTSNTANEVFTVTLTGTISGTVTVPYQTADDTAKSPTDYTAKSGTLTFNAQTTSQKVTVAVAGNTAYNPNEQFKLVLTSPSGVQPATVTGVGKIINNNPAPTLAINSVSVNKPTTLGGVANAVFTVTLTGATELPASVQYSTADTATAVAGIDYTAKSGTLTFGVGTTSQQITVAVLGSGVYNGNQQFKVNLNAGTISNAALDPNNPNSGVGTGTILVTAPTFKISDLTTPGGAQGVTTPFVFTVTLNEQLASPVTVHFATADTATATAGTDYQANSGTLTFAAGVTSQTITVQVFGQTGSEASRTFLVDLSQPNPNIAFSKQEGVGTILPHPIVSTISGRVYVDNAVTGTVDTSKDYLLLHASVTLTDSSNNKVTALTDQNGNYSFANVNPGTYTLSFKNSAFVPEKAVVGSPNLGTPNTTTKSDIQITIPSTGGIAATGYDFVEQRGFSPSFVSSRLFLLGNLPSSGTLDMNSSLFPQSTTASTAAVTAAVTPAVSSQAVTPAATTTGLVTQQGSTVTVHGTDGNDQFTFTAGTKDVVTINGQTFQFDPAVVKSVVFDGGKGKNTVVLNGAGANETATVGLGSATLSGAAFSVSVSNATTLTVNANGSGSQAVLHDSALADHLSADADWIGLSNTAGFATTLHGFGRVQAVSSGGADTKHIGAIDFALETLGSWTND